MIVTVDSYRFHTEPLYDNNVFTLDIPNYSNAQKIKLLSKALLKTYSPDYMVYLINTKIPTFLIKPEFLCEN